MAGLEPPRDGKKRLSIKICFKNESFLVRGRVGDGSEKKEKLFSFKIPFKINRLMSTAGSETPGSRKKIRFAIQNPFKINRFLSVAGSEPKIQATMNNFSPVAGSETARRRWKRFSTVPSRNPIFDALAPSSRAAPISPYRRDFRCSQLFFTGSAESTCDLTSLCVFLGATFDNHFGGFSNGQKNVRTVECVKKNRVFH